MKYIIPLFFLLISNSYADCVEFVLQFDDYSNRKMIAYNDWVAIESSYKTCSTSSDMDSKFQVLKQKRIQTLKNYEKLGIKEEAGISLYEHFNKLGEKSKPVINNITPPSKNNTNCKEVTISNEAVNFSNTRNQDGVGWCYAYASSDLLSYKYNQRLSAISFSSRGRYSLQDQFKDEQKQGADVREAIEEAYKRLKGFCLEKSLKSTDVNFCHFQDIKELLSFLSLAENKELTTCTESDLLSIFPRMNLSAFIFASGAVEKAYLEKLIDEHCTKEKLNVPEPKIKTFIAPYATNPQIKNVIDNEIDKKNPVVWVFDVNKMLGKPGPGDHVGMVMGRKFNPQTNKCEYLIRNSWGKTCEFEKNGNPTRCHTENGRLTGYFYVTEDYLLQNSLGAYYAE